MDILLTATGVSRKNHDFTNGEVETGAQEDTHSKGGWQEVW